MSLPLERRGLQSLIKNDVQPELKSHNLEGICLKKKTRSYGSKSREFIAVICRRVSSASGSTVAAARNFFAARANPHSCNYSRLNFAQAVALLDVNQSCFSV